MVWTSTKTTLATAACFDTKGSTHETEIYAHLAPVNPEFDCRSGLNRPFATRRLACQT